MKRGKWVLGRWIDEFVAGVDEFADRDAALRKADDLRRDFEARGFREEF